MKQRVVIIGSGLGGLSTALILQRQGFDTIVLEQGSQIGGCLQCFTRAGAHFETGMHFIGSADKGQTLARLLKFLEIDEKISLSRLDITGYDSIYLASQKFSIPNGREAFIEKLGASFPKEKDAIARYHDLITSVAGASQLHTLDTQSTDISKSRQYQLISVNEVVDSIFTDPLLKNIVVGQLPLYAGERDRTPFSTHAFIFDFYNQSAFRIVGGSDRIAEALRFNIERYGGQVFTSQRVTKVICDSQKAIAVEVNNNTEIPTDFVISAIHPASLMAITPSSLIRPAFRQRMVNLPNTISVFSLYVKFRPQSVPYCNSNNFVYKDATPWNCEKYSSNTWPKGYLYMHLCPHDGMQWAETAVVLSYMKIEDVAQWRGTNIGHRGEDYLTFKKQRAQQLIAAIEKDFPGFTASVEKYWTATPLTYEDYTGTIDGSMYGVAKDITLGTACRVPQRTRIPNLLQTGQNINSHGMLGTLVGSIVTTSEFLGADRLFSLISCYQT